MANFDFIDSTSNLTFDFGLTGDASDFDFTIISSGDVEYDFTFGPGVFIYNIFRGTSNNFNSIYADKDTSLNSGRFYVGRQEDLTIINQKNGEIILEDYYSKTTAGSAEETLKVVDLVDINVTY